MIQRETFFASLSADVTSAEIQYAPGNVQVYKAVDFNKIRFPVQKATLITEPRKAKHVGNGDWVNPTRRKVRS